MVNRIGTVYPCGSNKGVQFESVQVDGRRYWPKLCDYNNKDEVNSLNILSNNDYQVPSQKFRQLKDT